MDKVKEMEKDLIDLYISCEDITGIYISGSLADGTYDQFSDVDIRYITHSGDIESCLLDCIEKLSSLDHKVLFYEPCGFKNAVIPHFDNFIKADIFFYSESMLTPSVWMKNIKIVKDESGFLHKIKNDSKDLEFYPDSNLISGNIDKFFALSHECYRRIQRGEFLYADQLLSAMKLKIINFTDWHKGSADIGLYKAEKRFNIELLEILNKRITNKSDLRNLDAINKSFLNIERELCESLDIKRDFENDDCVLFYAMR